MILGAMVLGLTGASAAVAATHSPLSSTAAPTALVIEKAGGVSIKIPTSWKRQPAASATLGKIRQRINFLAPGREFWGITVWSSKDMPGLIGAFSPEETAPLQDLARATLGNSRGISNLEITASDDLIAGFSALATYDLRVSGKTTYSVVTYWVVSGGRYFVLAGTTNKGRMAVHRSAFTEIFDSFRPR
jgi:hypothetical protein